MIRYKYDFLLENQFKKIMVKTVISGNKEKRDGFLLDKNSSADSNLKHIANLSPISTSQNMPDHSGSDSEISSIASTSLSEDDSSQCGDISSDTVAFSLSSANDSMGVEQLPQWFTYQIKWGNKPARKAIELVYQNAQNEHVKGLINIRQFWILQNMRPCCDETPHVDDIYKAAFIANGLSLNYFQNHKLLKAIKSLKLFWSAMPSYIKVDLMRSRSRAMVVSDHTLQVKSKSVPNDLKKPIKKKRKATVNAKKWLKKLPGQLTGLCTEQGLLINGYEPVLRKIHPKTIRSDKDLYNQLNQLPQTEGQKIIKALSDLVRQEQRRDISLIKNPSRLFSTPTSVLKKHRSPALSIGQEKVDIDPINKTSARLEYIKLNYNLKSVKALLNEVDLFEKIHLNTGSNVLAIKQILLQFSGLSGMRDYKENVHLAQLALELQGVYQEPRKLAKAWMHMINEHDQLKIRPKEEAINHVQEMRNEYGQLTNLKTNISDDRELAKKMIDRYLQNNCKGPIYIKTQSQDMLEGILEGLTEFKNKNKYLPELDIDTNLTGFDEQIEKLRLIENDKFLQSLEIKSAISP